MEIKKNQLATLLTFFQFFFITLPCKDINS